MQTNFIAVAFLASATLGVTSVSADAIAQDVDTKAISQYFHDLKKIKDQTALTDWVKKHVATKRVIPQTFSLAQYRKFRKGDPSLLKQLIELYPAFISSQVFGFLDQLKKGNITIANDPNKKQMGDLRAVVCTFTYNNEKIEAKVTLDHNLVYDIDIDGANIHTILRAELDTIYGTDQQITPEKILEGMKQSIQKNSAPIRKQKG